MVFTNQRLYINRTHYQLLPIDFNAASPLLFSHALAYGIFKHFDI